VLLDADHRRPPTSPAGYGCAPSAANLTMLENRNTPSNLPSHPSLMKIVGWIILIIFLIGLAVVLGLGKLIF
jgi:hypothetical protein